MPHDRLLITRIREIMRAEAPLGVFAIDHGEHILLPWPRAHSWVEIKPAGPFNRWQCTEYRPSGDPITSTADSHWQILAWLLLRWRSAQPYSSSPTSEPPPCHA